jgi:hypothetical protein
MSRGPGESGPTPLTPVAIKRVAKTSREPPRGGRNGTQVGGEAELSPVERFLVAALVSAIVKELQAGQPPRRLPAA